MWSTMRKPKWLALLVGVLVVVGAFGWLGWWQLTSAFSAALPPEEAAAYETSVPLEALLEPGAGLVESAAGRPVTVRGWLDLREATTVADRVQGERVGYWLVGRVVVAGEPLGAPAEADATVAAVRPSIPIAIAWGADEEAVRTAGAQLAARIPALPGADAADAAGAVELAAQLQPGQDPMVPRRAPDAQTVLTMAPGQLINLWQEPSPAYYSAYLVLDGEPAGGLPAPLEAIGIVPVDQSLQINLLNIFYAIEWAIFIVMSFYIWWRLVRDEHLALQAAAASGDERLAAEIRREKLRALAAARDGATPTTTHPDNRPAEPGPEDR